MFEDEELSELMEDGGYDESEALVLVEKFLEKKGLIGQFRKFASDELNKNDEDEEPEGNDSDDDEEEDEDGEGTGDADESE